MAARILRCVVAAAALTGATLSGCAVGPDYQRPAAETPQSWTPAGAWNPATPVDGEVKGRWWEVFADPQLDALIGQALSANQNLKVASARLGQARDQLMIARADLFPTIGVAAGASRDRISANRPLSSYTTPNQTTTQNDFRVGPAASYEVDLFGRVRRQVEGASAEAEQAVADFENTRLVLTAQLASDYFSLRELDGEIEVVRKVLELEQDALKFITARHDLGLATGLDLAQQQALLQANEAQLELLINQRLQFEHAIATLVGTPAPGFVLAPDPVTAPVPALPVGVPSDLLQRRPDVAAAERAMAAANARIGVAKAAYFPSINLAPGLGVPGFGWESAAISSLFDAPSRVWAIGLSATQTVFDAGRTRGNVRYARGDYDASVATYRQTVLQAMEEVENGITGIAALDQAAARADASVESAQRAYDIASERYKGGVDTYLDVLTAEQALLNNQRQAVQIKGQQYGTAVFLVRALGGGWSGDISQVSRNQ